MSNILDKIKLSGVTYDIIDATAVHSLDGYYTSGQTNDAITAATSALAETIGNMHYQTSGDVQNTVDAAVSGKVDTTAYTAYTAATETALGKKFEGVNYDSNSKHINFYNNASATGSVLAYIDASDFIKDGMVNNVEVKEVSGVTSLVISFNTDAGKEDIVIPISSIFDASNYYTKAEVDAELSGKTDTATTSSINDTLTAHTANTDIHVTTSDKSTWSGKQDALVSGTNIKTVGGNSLLGSGDVPFPPGMTAEVSGTTLIFS